jgi:uncharacterized protein
LKKKLEALEQMQEIDIQIDALKNVQNSLNVEIDGIEQGLVTAREELEVLQAQVSRLEQEKLEQETSLAAEQENIRRSETNMKEIKTNKEFQAVGREIAAARKLTVELEEQILQKLGQVESLNSELAEKAANLAELEQNSGQRRDEKQAEIDVIQKDIDAGSERRESLTKELPASLVKRYVSLREQRRGQAIAIARDGYCLGCNMHLPPQLYNNLFRADELISCPHCQRMLVLKQQKA